MQQELWSLGSATAAVDWSDEEAVATLLGVVTAAAYEALHVRLAAHAARRRTIEIHDTALIVATSLSLTEAAVRGTPSKQTGPRFAIVIAVRPWRMAWAAHHCALMCHEGLSRAAVLAGARAGAARAEC